MDPLPRKTPSGTPDASSTTDGLPGPIHRGDGDGWVDCTCGRRHWGKYGAAGLLVHDGGRILLQHRAAWSDGGDTWALPGGARNSGEDGLQGALREAHEEAGVLSQDVEPHFAMILDHHAWSYTTVVARAVRSFGAVATDPESQEMDWVPVDQVSSYNLLPSFASSWLRLKAMLEARATLIVDAANVVGSKPDGWWHDRAAATRRLRDGLERLSRTGILGEILGLRGADLWWPTIVMVVEAEARSVRSGHRIEVIPAPRSGDDVIVEQAALAARDGSLTIVATADRELRRRCRAVGADDMGPMSLLDAMRAAQQEVPGQMPDSP